VDKGLTSRLMGMDTDRRLESEWASLAGTTSTVGGLAGDGELDGDVPRARAARPVSLWVFSAFLSAHWSRHSEGECKRGLMCGRHDA
jgi:hypothetical protein